MADLQIIGGRTLTMADLEKMNEEEIKSRKYRYCTVNVDTYGPLIAMVAYSEAVKAWEPTHVYVDGEWIEFDEDMFDMVAYSCENYRFDP